MGFSSRNPNPSHPPFRDALYGLLGLHVAADLADAGLELPRPIPLPRGLPPRLYNRIRARRRRLLLVRRLCISTHPRSGPRRVPSGQQGLLVHRGLLRKEPLLDFPHRIAWEQHGSTPPMGDTVKLFDVTVDASDPCTLSYTPSPGSQINSVKWNHTYLVVASAGDDKKISLWNKNGQSMGSFPSHGSDLADDIEFAYAGSSILGKLALGQGLSALVFVVYRHLIAMLILAPLAYVLERNRRPSFSFGVMLKIFILAMLGITIQQNVYYVGLHLISPTVASALGNVIPAFTFLLAIVLRMEKLNLKTVRGRAKLAGAIFCITGALIFTFWKGSALMLFDYFACSVSLVLQASICEIYPAKLTMNAVMCFFAALQSSALSLIFERNASSWRMFPLFTHLILCIVFVWFTNLKYSRVEIDEVRFEWAECMLDYI
ncbi:hypothetical protein ZIOFF_056084 [Zingiber officinale]|uniref:EamA domain-containing protein n=1 Tax=Zingiber officinale TaxID=94328 RepID=A0A8J5FN43_ZINOF|nr:hypothetical protein ZIOFF_056084 [Zingiber officinale]